MWDRGRRQAEPGIPVLAAVRAGCEASVELVLINLVFH
jgi:hypothetical protein